MRAKKQLPSIEQMIADNENYKQTLLMHFEDAPFDLIIEALLESKGINKESLSDGELDVIDDFISLIYEYE